MAYNVVLTADAERPLRSLTVRKQRIVEDGVEDRLIDQPLRLSRAIKALHANPFAQYELRLDADLRVLYQVSHDEQVVTIVAVGEKAANKLIVEGREFHEHESHPVE